MKTLTIISKYELTNEEKHIIQDIYKTAENQKSR